MAIRTKEQDLLFQAATRYVNRGWSVIPIERGTKKARVSWQGYQTWRPDERLLRNWWVTRWPGDGIGVICGEISGVVVVDIDNPDLAAADIEKNGGLPVTPTVRTAKGKHYYFAWPGFAINGKLPWGDLKGQGGYVLAPPSIHPVTKQPYEWEASPKDTPLASLPSWIIDLCRSHRIATTQMEGEQAGGISIAPPVDKRIAAGERNQALTSLAGTMRRRGMTPEEIYPSLVQINLSRCDPPLDESEVRAISDSMARYAPAEEARPLPAVEEPAAQMLNSFHQTDTGNAEALVWLFGDCLRFDHTRQKWLVWDGVRWRPDRDGGIDRMAREMVRQREAAAIQERGQDAKKELSKWARGSESRPRLAASLSLAATERPITATGEQFDDNDWLLACGNGVIDLTTGELLPGDPAQMLTLSTGVEYDAYAECPRWLQFLDEIFLGDKDLISFIRRAIGYTLSGSTREQCLFLCYGSGANGKSVFLSVLHDILGEYAHNADFATFMEGQTQSGSSATPDVIALKGARLVTASEVKEDRRINEARIKSLTGGDKVTGRPLYGEPLTFVPSFKLWLAVNHRPIIRETGPAIWRRMRLIPFRAYFPPETADPDLKETLLAEAPGILAWAVAGCAAWQAGGLPTPEAVVAETASYKDAQDIIAAFLEACCEEGPGKQVRAGTLYNVYRRWCEENGERPLSSTAFGARMGEKFAKVHQRDGWIYHGVGIMDGIRGPTQGQF